MTDSVKVQQMIDNLEVTPLNGDEQIDDNLLQGFVSLFEQLVISSSLEALVSQISIIDTLNTNTATKCAILYSASIFIEEATKNF